MSLKSITDSTTEPYLSGNGYLPVLFKTLCENGYDLERISRIEKICSGKVVSVEGQVPERIGYILDGILAIGKILPDGRGNIVGLLGPGNMYGRTFDNSPICQVKALTDSRILTIDRLALEKICAQEPEVDRLLLTNVLDEIDSAREWILLLGCYRVVQRVASYLLILCRHKMRTMRDGKLTDRKPMRVKVEIKRNDLAHYLGARVESLSRAFHELEARGAVIMIDAYEFEIVDLEMLVEIANHDIVKLG